MRKILAIILGIVGVLAIGWLVYYLVSRTAAPTAGTKTTKSPGNEQTSANQLKIISKEPVFDYWTSSSTQEIIYINEEGKIAKINQDKFLSEQIISSLNSAQLSPDGQNVLVSFVSSNQPQFSVFNLVNNTWYPLPLTIKSLAWSPESKRMAAILSQNNQTDLAILAETGGKPKTIIQNFSLQDLRMEWLTPDEIIFTDKPSGQAAGSAWRLNFAKPTKTTFTEIVPPGNGLMIKWLKENLGIKLQNQQSSLINWAGQTINNFSLMVLPDKCVLKSDSLYCFLFTPANPKTNWPDDYLQKAVYTKDDLYKFDLNNLTAPKLIFQSAANGKTIDATDVKILGNQILFINRYDNQLYSLEVNE